MPNMLAENLTLRVENALEQLRPFLQADGGNITLEYIEDNTVYVKLHGSCVNCSMSHMTMKTGVEEAVKKAAPEIEKVIALDSRTQL
jgi:Fe-S cluster biogenesis protein NfuA